MKFRKSISNEIGIFYKEVEDKRKASKSNRNLSKRKFNLNRKYNVYIFLTAVRKWESIYS